MDFPYPQVPVGAPSRNSSHVGGRFRVNEIMSLEHETVHSGKPIQARRVNGSIGLRSGSFSNHFCAFVPNTIYIGIFRDFGASWRFSTRR